MKINTKKYFEVSILISYVVIIIYTYLTSILNSLINPNVHIYILLTSIVFILFILVEILYSNSHKEKLKYSDIIYVIPLILVFFLGNGSISSSLVNNKGVNITNSNTVINNVNNEKIKSLEISPLNFSATQAKLANNLNNYIGSEFTVDGFVFKEEGMLENELVIARLSMSCCTADARVVGFLAKYDNEILKKDTWYTFKGKIDVKKEEAGDFPYFLITEITPITKPVNEYIY